MTPAFDFLWWAADALSRLAMLGYFVVGTVVLLGGIATIGPTPHRRPWPFWLVATTIPWALYAASLLIRALLWVVGALD